MTIKDVAKKTGYSMATISKYINGGKVKPRYAENIQKVIEELKFKPNYIAQALRSNTTYTVGVLVPDLVNLFSMHIVSSLEWELQKSGYCTLVCDCANDVQFEGAKIQFLLDKQVDGLVIMPCSYEGGHIKEIVNNKVPIVLIDRLCNNLDVDAIITNNKEISEKATSYLLDSFSRVAIVCSKNIYTADERMQGYLDAHANKNATVFDRYIKMGHNTIRGGYEAMNELWIESKRPEALFITNYEMTIGVMMAINELGINISTEITIIGFDSIDLVKVVKPSLMAISQPMDAIGKTAGKQILTRIKSKDYSNPKRIILNAEFNGK